MGHWSSIFKLRFRGTECEFNLCFYLLVLLFYFFVLMLMITDKIEFGSLNVRGLKDTFKRKVFFIFIL